ncbi:protein CREG1 [Sminthopsis crassicaudata]|uniref:protein CREG1 n=1 Tax=Sminthopsis crassicaudata TaxID=9301 RepID=UPI003D68B468
MRLGTAALRALPPPLLLLLLLLLPLASPDTAGALELPPREDVARMARFIVHKCDWGALATVSTMPAVDGRPFANIFSLSDGPTDGSSGVPYFYLSPLQTSVGDLQANPNAGLTLSLAQTGFCKKHEFDPQSPLCAHIMLSGTVTKVVNDTEIAFAKKSLFTRHPEMESWPSDHNWFFAKFTITNIWVIDFFGGAKTVTPEEYFKAKP